MKRILLVLAAVLAASLRAQAPEPMPLAHGNTPGEPHHHLKIENEYVRAYYVEVPPRQDTELHQHDHDYLFVTLGDSEVINAVRDKPEVHLVLKDGETHFTRGGFAHVARNLSDAPFRNITIELLKPQEGAQNVCAPVIPNPAFAHCDVSESTRSMSLPLFESKEARLDTVSLDPREKHAVRATKLAFLVVGLNSNIKLHAKGESVKTLREGEIAWFDPGSNLLFSNDGNKPAQFLELICKDSAVPPKP